MSYEANKSLAHNFYEECISRGNVDVIDRVHTSDYKFHIISYPNKIYDNNQYKKLFEDLIRAFPVRKTILEDIIAWGDKVITRSTINAIHTSKIFGIQPTGKNIVIASIIISKFTDGKIQEEWGIWDEAGFYRQLGVLKPKKEAIAMSAI